MLEKEILNDYGRYSNEYISITWEIAQDYLGLHDSDKATKYMVTCFLSMIRFYPENDIHPWQDERYHDLTETLFSLLDKSTDDSYRYKLEYLKTQFIDEELYGYESFMNLHKLTRFFLYHNDYKNVKDFSSLLGELTLKHKGITSSEYAEYLYYNIEAGTHSSDYDYAARFMELASEARASWEDNDHNNFLISYASTSAYLTFKKYDLAQTEYARLNSILDSHQFTISNIQKANCYGLGSSVYLASDLTKAKECIDLAIQLREDSGVYDYSGYRDLALYYKKIGEFDLAIQAYYSALNCITDDSFFELERRNQRARYYTAILGIASCLQEMGRNADSRNWLEIAINGIERNCGPTSSEYASALLERSSFYSSIRNNTLALKDAQTAASLYESLYSNKSEPYAIAMLNAGVYSLRSGDAPSSINYLNISIDILERLYGNSSELIAPYITIGESYLQLGDKEKCILYWNRAEDLINEFRCQNSALGFALYGSVGYHLLKNNDTSSIDYLSKALEIGKLIGIANSPQYLYYNQCYYQALLKFDRDSIPEIKPLFDSFTAAYYENFAFYLGGEREQYLSGKEFAELKDLLFNLGQSKAEPTVLYDYLLFSKGLLLDTAISLEAIAKNNDEKDVKQYYDSLISIRSKIQRIQTDNENLKGIDSLFVKQLFYERGLLGILKERIDLSSKRAVHYNDIREALKADECALEFVEYDGKIAVLIGRHDWKEPKSIQLCNSSELNHLLGQSPNVLYGDSSLADSLYSFIWSPISDYVKNCKTIHYSLDGVLNGFSIEAILSPKNRHLFELYNMRQCSSTRELLHSKRNDELADVALFGGIEYDVKPSLASQQEVDSNELLDLSYIQTRRGWNYLPGSLEEVNSIGALLKNRSIPFHLYTGEKGREESFKGLNGRECPTIIHIATHGFYYSDKESRKIEYFTTFQTNQLSETETVSPYKSMLKRSGLMMSGANNYWEHAIRPSKTEDGILTAEEISELDLSKSSLVVLSACQTGLGDISNEGVIGLQRAFKMAGVETIVMSLWEIDDRATADFMGYFYKSLITGHDKRQAFREAQRQLKKKYDNPYYWAAFVMLD